jgi:methylthioxylose transferase
MAGASFRHGTTRSHVVTRACAAMTVTLGIGRASSGRKSLRSSFGRPGSPGGGSIVWEVATPAQGVRSTPPRALRRSRPSATAAGLIGGLLLMAAAVAVPPLTGWRVHVRAPPLAAAWDPRWGIGTWPAVAIGAGACLCAHELARRMRWWRLLVATYVAGLAWLLALAYVDGRYGIAHPLRSPSEYLLTARATDDVPGTLHDFVSRILSTAAHPWPVHVAGHPPGALLFFVLLVRLGLGAGFAAGLAVTMTAASTAVAVLIVVRRLGSEQVARKVAPFLVFGPAAVWQAVSADAVFAAVAAWCLVAFAVAATTRRRIVCAIVAGLLFGACLLLSYGLVLLAVLALAVLWLAGDFRPLVYATPVAAAVVAAFAGLGVPYWSAWAAVHERYWAGIAALRPTAYWLWADLAAALFSVGPLAAAGLGNLVRPLVWRTAAQPQLVPAVLGTAALLSILIADASLMSKAEVERIWLPFCPWLLLPVALLSVRWRRAGLVLQVATALAIQHLLFTMW